MKNQLLTYEQCQEIVAKNAEKNFYEKVEVVDGYKISIFNYILSVYDWFKTPFEGATYPAYEMRGLTFVHTESGPKRYLALHKFFNLNENEDNQVDKLKEHSVVMVQEKLDGSMIQMIRLPNGKILCKTKIGLTNTQARMAMSCLSKDKDLYSFVSNCLDQGLAPIFELCSPLNRIVVEYDQTELRLIQLRDETSGLYLDFYSHPLVLKYRPKLAKQYPVYTFDELLEKQKVEENREGYVVTLSNGFKAKLKTMWYFERHRLMDSVASEDTLVSLICEEKLDDAIALLDKTNERRVYAEKMQLFLSHHIKEQIDQAMDLLSKYNGNRKDFAMAYRDNSLFPVVVKLLDKKSDDTIEEMSSMIKKRIAQTCFRLEKARNYLKANGFEVEGFRSLDDE